MKLRRFREKGLSSAGTWLSADNRWIFIVYSARKGRGAWAISATKDKDKLWLISIGLRNINPPHTRFKTRREAVEALELALPGAP